MSLVLGTSTTPKVTSKSTSEMSAAKLAAPESCRPARFVALRSRSPKLALVVTAPGLKFSFCRRNESDFVADE
jgi:hypothetical protein